MRYDGDLKQSAIIVADAGGGGERTLITRGDPTKLSTKRIAWSPDGRSIAYAAGAYGNERDHRVYEVSVADGAERLLSQQPWPVIQGVAWLGGRGALALLASDSGTRQCLIWRLALPGGERRALTTELYANTDLSVTADGKSIITIQFEDKQSLLFAAMVSQWALARLRRHARAIKQSLANAARRRAATAAGRLRPSMDYTLRVVA